TALMISACDEPSRDDGTIVTELLLPTDVVLNLACENVGINDEQCVLNDPENPFATIAIIEFDENNPGAENKFDLANEIPAGPTGAKARFYFWATALARRPSGENQWFTARALHELFDANSNIIFEDELVRAQALNAYRSVLDNFFGSVTFFTFGGVAFPAPLNEQVARDLFFDDETGFRRLVPTQLEVLGLFGEWGYTYDPEIDLVTRNGG
ncbi:MAG: hypothetical protein AAF438_15560, partial [Pseudomonadota bacterium]